MKNKTLIITALILILSMNAVAETSKVTMYFFWGKGCSHCTDMKPFIQELDDKYPYLEIKSLEVLNNEENWALMQNITEAYNTTFHGVPDVFVGNKNVIGYGGNKTETLIISLIENCSRDNCQSPDEILQEYRSRPKPTSTTTSSTTTTTTTTSATSSTTTSSTTSTTPISTTTTTEEITTSTTEPPTTTTTKPEDTTNKTTTQPWIYGTIGIAVILITFGLSAKKKSTLKGIPKEGKK
jgi:thiol-disulfide isomerase/thioredoxin